MILTLHGDSATINSQGAFDFTNHIKSNIDIEANSSIALVNATIERLSELIIGSSNGTIKMELDNNSPLLKELHIPSGVYNTATLASALASVINTQFSQHGYTFYVGYDKKEDKFNINWHEGSVKGTGGKPKFANLQTDLTQSIAVKGTKLSIATGTVVNQWYMGRSSNKMPDYKVFDEPHQALQGVYISARLNLPNTAQTIIGITSVEEYPDPNNHQEGCFGFKVRNNGQVEISEGRMNDVELDYLSGNVWTSSIGVPDVYTLHDYHGTHGYDYIAIPNGNPANTRYIKKIGDGSTLHISINETAVFTQIGTLDIATKTVIQWADLTGAGISTWTSTTGAKLTNNSSKVVYSKATPAIHMNGGVGTNNGGGKICASWGGSGYVHYFYRNESDSHWTEIHISSPDRVPVSEMFGSGLGLMQYGGIRTPTVFDAVSNNIFQMVSLVSASLDISECDLEDANVYKLNEATYTSASTANPVNKIVMGTTNPSQVIMRNTEEMFLATNAIPKGTYGVFTFVIPTISEELDWTIGLLGDNSITNITPNGSNRSPANMAIGVQNYDSGGGIWGVKVWFNNAQTGYFKNYTQMGTEPKISININHNGGVEVNYSTKALGYSDLVSLHNNVINIPNDYNFLPMITSSNTGSAEFTTLMIETEKLTQHTGLVHFDSYQMSNVLGMNGLQASDDGAIGFISSNKPDVEPEECDNPTIHLQLKNMPIVSLNGHTSRTEKTLAVIPRYTSDQHSGKGLESVFYYEPNNLLYKNLNNPRKIVLNSLNVQLTNNDGTLAKDVSCFDCTLDIRPTGY